MPAKRRRPVEPERRTFPPETIDILAITALAFGLRYLYIASLRGMPVFEVLQVNAARYDTWARLILAGKAPGAPFEQGPAYACFLSFVYAVRGTAVLTLAILQFAIGAATVALLYAVAHRLGGRTAAAATGIAAAAYGPLIYFTAEVLPASLFVFSIAAAVACAVVPAPRRWFASGLFWALAFLFRSNTVLALPFALLHAWRSEGRGAATRLAAPVLAVVLGLYALNVTAGFPSVWSTTGGGVNLWLGNNPTADGVNPFFGPAQSEIDKEVRAAASTAAAADRAFTAKAATFWKEEPVAALALAAKKLVWTFSAEELSNNVAIDWKRAHSALFRLPVFPFGFGIVLVFAFAFLGLGWRREEASPRTDLLALLAPLVLGAGTCVLFFTNARFRLPMAVPLLVLAGLGIGEILARIRSGAVDVKSAARASLAATAAVVLTYGDWWDVRDYRIPQLDVNAGAMEREARNFESAILFLRSGVGREPRDPIGWVHLALALEQSGDVDAAREAYTSGLGYVPGDADLLQMQQRFRERNPVP